MSLERILYEVRKQKAKYFSKLLSEDARYANLLINFNLSDIFTELTWLYLNLYLNISLGLSLELKLPPIDFEDIELDFEVELPDFSEIQQGIWIKFKKISFKDIIKKLWEETNQEIFKKIKESLENFNNLIKNNVTPPYAGQISSTSPQKAIYGKSRFGKSYYDPQALYDFYTSTLVGFFKNRTSYEALKQIIDNAKDSLNVHEPIAKLFYNRMVMITEALYQNFVLGYGILGKSRLTPKYEGNKILSFLNYDGEELSVYYRDLFGLHAGFILGVSVLGYDYLVPKDSVYTKPQPPIIVGINEKIYRANRRFPFMWVGASNYVKTEEMETFTRCDRADQYMQLQVTRYFIENSVAEMLRNENIPITQVRQYKNAVLQLMSLKYKRHKWGYRSFESMSEEELKQWWINYWVKQGLNAKILSDLWDKLWLVLKELGKQKKALGLLVQQRRKYLASLLH